MRSGWADHIGAVLVVLSPLMWAVTALLDWPRPVQRTFMWSTIALGAVVLIAMAAAPFITNIERRAWKAFSAPEGVEYAAADRHAADMLRGFPMYPFDFPGDAETNALDVLRTRCGAVPVMTFRFTRKAIGEPRSIHQVLAAELPHDLPYLSLTAAGEASGAAAGGHRIQLRHGELRHRYLISTYDDSPAARKYAVDVLNPRAVQGLLAHEPVDLTIDGRYAVMTSLFPGKPDHAQRLLETYGRALAGLVELIPRHVYEEHARQPEL